MKRHVFNISVILLVIVPGTSAYPHVYLVYHATFNGETGHTGIAIDNYMITYGSKELRGSAKCRPDTIRTGTLTYYDFWTKEENPEKSWVARNLEPRYYKLPVASWEPEITLSYLYYKGIPYRVGYTAEGLLQVTTTPARDWKTKAFLDSLILANRPFNSISYNCSDFAEQALEVSTGEKINAKEFVLIGFTTTPNKLFKKASMIEGTKIIKDPGTMVNRIFLIERILKREILSVCGNQKRKK